MHGSDLQQQLQTLQDKYRKVMEQIAFHRLDLLEKKQELALLDAEVQQARYEKLDARRAELEMFLSTPPARNGWGDKQRLATSWIRPLTRTEMAIMAMKGSWTNRTLAALSRQASALYSADVRQLRQQVWREWDYERRNLERKVEHLAQDILDERETSEQQSLRKEIAQLQRDISRLELQAQFLLIDIEGLERRIAAQPEHP
jgi:peptidoglycan hydrolase CwlO-like protein